jgi:hypothetical protein
MQHLEGTGMPVLYIGRTVLKGQSHLFVFLSLSLFFSSPFIFSHLRHFPPFSSLLILLASLHSTLFFISTFRQTKTRTFHMPYPYQLLHVSYAKPCVLFFRNYSMCTVLINFQIPQPYYVLYIINTNQSPYRRSVQRLATSWGPGIKSLQNML